MSENEITLLRPNSRTLAVKRPTIEVPFNVLHLADEDLKKEEWQPRYFQSIQISEYNYRELDRLVDEMLYIDSMRLEL
jgi:hypothetical protein|tara:strand:- start:950 stop:1183 length:234 start_codon:yes stop_codon:yes gene_type:complete